MAFVADNSVVLAWFVSSQSTAYSEKMLRRVAREPIHMPVVWPLEFANALRQLERRRKLKPEATSDLLDAVDALGLQSDASPPANGACSTWPGSTTCRSTTLHISNSPSGWRCHWQPRTARSRRRPRRRD